MQLNHSHNSLQQGVSLVELMVGMVIGLLVIIAALSMYASTSRGARDTLGSAKLNMEIRGAMDVMIEDIRRAGFGGNTFMNVGSTDLAVYDSGACIVYSYNADNSLDAEGNPNLTDGDYAGFSVQNNTVFIRNGGDGDASDCATDVEWEPITDPNNVQIDAPAGNEPFFTIEYACLDSSLALSANNPKAERCLPGTGNTIYNAALATATANNSKIGLIETRHVTIRLAGHLTNDATMRISMAQTVLVRNHRAVIVP